MEQFSESILATEKEVACLFCCFVQGKLMETGKYYPLRSSKSGCLRRNGVVLDKMSFVGNEWSGIRLVTI